ncbi:unnamed protein product [Prunus armeniaca]|uniref:Disease resistance protein At4g27190-like leucine-rich repeats domain-containing protein n=1 Tax=Prunus armeniaca TaxID=36596 RepID=A0A6J5WTJ4_PRUAR|nr:unnamed protein product [Prunus armeniaca]
MDLVISLPKSIWYVDNNRLPVGRPVQAQGGALAPPVARKLHYNCWSCTSAGRTQPTLHIEDCPRLGTFIFDRKSEITSIGKKMTIGTPRRILRLLYHAFFFMKSLERLIIYDLPALMTVWHNQLAQDSFCRLKEVNVYRCHNLINIFARSMMGRLNALYRLEIWQCQLLQVVFELGGVFEAYDTSTTQLKTFECPNLDFVEIDACERLINIFSASVAKGLEQLTKLSVENCGSMEINVKEKGLEATPKFVFPKVTVVKFENLPQLRMFYPGMHVSEWPLLKELEMTACDNVEIFASEISRFQKKLELGLQCTPIKHPFFLVEKVLMPNLTSLVVSGCGGLRFLFSSSMARSLVQLKNLTISRCQIMEEIVPTNESNEEDTDHNMFSQLQDLKLLYLPNLTRFCSARRSINFHSLEILHLKDCSKLETFIFDPMSTNITINRATEEIRDSMENIGTDAFLFDEKVGFPSLESLIIYEIPKLRTIWHCQLAPDSFRKLKEVEVLRCQSLINIFAPSMMED